MRSVCVWCLVWFFILSKDQSCVHIGPICRRAYWFLYISKEIAQSLGSPHPHRHLLILKQHSNLPGYRFGLCIPFAKEIMQYTYVYKCG